MNTLNSLRHLEAIRASAQYPPRSFSLPSRWTPPPLAKFVVLLMLFWMMETTYVESAAHLMNDLLTPRRSGDIMAVMTAREMTPLAVDFLPMIYYPIALLEVLLDGLQMNPTL